MTLCLWALPDSVYLSHIAPGKSCQYIHMNKRAAFHSSCEMKSVSHVKVLHFTTLNFSFAFTNPCTSLLSQSHTLPLCHLVPTHKFFNLHLNMRPRVQFLLPASSRAPVSTFYSLKHSSSSLPSPRHLFLLLRGSPC